MTKGKNTVLAAALLASAAAVGTAQAQAAPAGDQSTTPAGATDASPAPGDDAGGIVVTAQRRAQRLVDVPVSVTAITGATLEKQAVTGIFEFARKLTADETGAAGNEY